MKPKGVWIIHNGGPCPIPNAKAGEYAVRWTRKTDNKTALEYEPTCDAINCAWEPVEYVGHKLRAYMLL